MILPVTCPLCKKTLTPDEQAAAYFPFCSPRCKQVDLMRWFDGKYAVVEPLDSARLAMELPETDELPED
ncbi:MAG: DNA gyrase inhibitor YacG [Planctomycetota bacterium]|nr:MAG: DNA gyrase inhibitor YacG [Planctomycetota bacterium]